MAVASGLEMIGGCATIETRKVKTLVYPPLPYNKIQPPQEGCLVGFYKEPKSYARLKDSRFIAQQWPETEAARRAKNIDEYVEMLKKGNFFEKMKRYQIGNEITYVEKALSTKPFIFLLGWPKLYSEFPGTQAMEVAKRGIVPFVYAGLGPFDLPIPIPGYGPKEIA